MARKVIHLQDYSQIRQFYLNVIRDFLSHLKGSWALIPELRIGTGYGKWAEQRIDIFAINCFPSKGYHKIAFEIKQTRSDFLDEIRKPLKRYPALVFSNQFFFVAPVDLIKPEEIPVETGLIEVYETGAITTKLQAPYREAYPPVWPLFASVARRLDRLGRKIDAGS